ncbi:uncharacterized protein Z518_01961 [Rhinocladiella mackenziei CBS 650.93]|uniref:Uncharacterized protein n=1 Tax=Rhinocladiella mackenziei CBS 650.93 TaxID=1442369 RepID=A0A0D2H9Z4_9EURO|nr:uncharacterized protein Z518_01961 [Rhinocladiella mackenziei CBS 650.93]KIX07308.1 hypothetical protein Z518_01961 [Rhinocladiella mackenziei CBS 650.93]
MASAATKRTRPSFSPPRPGKSKSTKSVRDIRKSTNGVKKARTSSGSNKAQARGKSPTQRRRHQQRHGPTQKQRGDGGTMRVILGDGEDDDDDVDDGKNEDLDMDSDPEGSSDSDDEDLENVDNDDGEEEDEGEDRDENQEQQASTPPLSLSSPEPDYILAEITHPNPSRRSKTNVNATSVTGEEPAIPLPLIHRIMQSHFTAPEKTTISTDARALLGKYIEIFVKEGIRRCVDERREREGGGAGRLDSGWLELEDLERVATQLCLDF